jgi:hypothetical protein
MARRRWIWRGGMNLGLGQGDEGAAVGDIEHLAVTEAGDGA